MANSEERIYYKHDTETEPALKYVMEQNQVVHVYQRGRRYFFDKRKPRTRNEFIRLEIPAALLESLRSRFSRGEPPQDFEGLIPIPKRRRQPAQKRGRK